MSLPERHMPMVIAPVQSIVAATSGATLPMSAPIRLAPANLAPLKFAS